jgi:predicted nucleic acid-binding protein
MADMLIASFCLAHDAALVSRDSGFRPMRDILGLQLLDPSPTA